MSKFLDEIHNEIKVRLAGYERELASYDSVEDRIAELHGLIAEAQTELASIAARLPQPEEEKAGA